MISGRRLLFGLLFTVVLISFASSTTLLINSNNWRTTYLGIMYGYNKGYHVYILSSIGDADVFARSVQKNDTIVVFEDSHDNILSNSGRYLKLRGFTDVKSIIVDDPLNKQIDLAKEFGDTCFIVIPSDYLMDTLSATPYALTHNCTVLMWDYAHGWNINEFLKSSKGSKIIFFGDIYERPWVMFKNATVIRGDSIQINRKMANMVMDHMSTRNGQRWAIVVDGHSLEPGYLLEKLPIVVYSGDIHEVVDFLLKNHIQHIEAIGPNIMNTASQIRETSGKKIGVVVKFGRTFTGIPGLNGVVYPISVMLGDYPTPLLDVYNIYLDTVHNKALLILQNKGNTKLLTSVPLLRFSNGTNTLGKVSDTSIYRLMKGQMLPLNFDLNGNFSSSVDTYLYAIYNQYMPLSLHVGEGVPPVRFGVVNKDLTDNTSVSLDRATYYTRSGKIVLGIHNNGSSTAYVFGQLNLRLDNTTAVLAPSKKYVSILPGKSGQLEFDMYLSDGDLMNNQNITVELFYGKKYPLLVNTQKVETVMFVYTPGVIDYITGMVSLAFETPWTYLLILLLLILWFIWKRRRKNKKGRKSRK